MLNGRRLCFFDCACVYSCWQQHVSVTRIIRDFTRQMDSLGYISEAIERRNESHSSPCYAMVIPCNANDAYARRRRKIFDCKANASLASRTAQRMRSYRNAPVRDPPTAPHPVSPKLRITLSLRAFQTVFEVTGVEFVGRISTGINSTRSHRF